MSGTVKARLLVICDSSSEGKFIYLKKKGDGTHSLTYSEEVESRSEGKEWIKREMRKVFGQREANGLMDRKDLFFEIECPDRSECNFAVVVAHGKIPNAISACKKKEPHPLEEVAKEALIAAPGQAYDGSVIRLSQSAYDIVMKVADYFHPKSAEAKRPVPVSA